MAGRLGAQLLTGPHARPACGLLAALAAAAALSAPDRHTYPCPLILLLPHPVIGDIERALQAVCARRQLSCRLHLKNEAAAVEADPGVVAGLEAATAQAQPMVAALLAQQRQQEAASSGGGAGPAGTCSAAASGGAQQACAAGGSGGPAAEGAADGSPSPKLVSGAGHDAMVFAQAGIPMGMLFVRCRCAGL